MKITLKNIVEAKEPLIKLSNEQLPVKTSYGIAKLIRAVDPELAVYNSERNKILKKYGKSTDGGKKFLIPKENEEDFQKEHDELLNQDVELNIAPILLPDTLRLSAQDILALDGLAEVIEDD